MIVFADADAVSTAHEVEFFGMLGGGQKDAGLDGSGRPAAQLAILPGLTHYNMGSSPALATVVGPFLEAAAPEAPDRAQGRASISRAPLCSTSSHDHEPIPVRVPEVEHGWHTTSEPQNLWIRVDAAGRQVGVIGFRVLACEADSCLDACGYTLAARNERDRRHRPRRRHLEPALTGAKRGVHPLFETELANVELERSLLVVDRYGDGVHVGDAGPRGFVHFVLLLLVYIRTNASRFAAPSLQDALLAVSRTAPSSGCLLRCSCGRRSCSGCENAGRRRPPSVALMELGRIGIWSSQLRDVHEGVREAAAELDELGYGAIWIPEGPAEFERAQDLLDATRRVVVATGIASIWSHPPAAAAAAHRDLTRAHPGRFLLGLGLSRKQVVDGERAGLYSHPLERMREYLDALDAGPNPVPPEERMLTALGPQMLALARDRSAGAHPYFVTVEHTKLARDMLGPERLLAPEQAVVLETDPIRARAIGRQHLSQYLQMPNYTNNWLRLGFNTDDLADGGSDRLVDGLVAWGTTDAIRNRIAGHRQAGADHVSIQVVTADASALPIAEWRTLAAALRPASFRP